MNISTLFTTISGWLLVALLVTTITLPYLAGTSSVRRNARALKLRPLRLHLWIGFAIVLIAIEHGWVSMRAGMALEANVSGLYLATVALLLLFIQATLGLILTRPLWRARVFLTRMHFWLMITLSAFTLGHVVLNSALSNVFRVRPTSPRSILSR